MHSSQLTWYVVWNEYQLFVSKAMNDKNDNDGNKI